VTLDPGRGTGDPLCLDVAEQTRHDDGPEAPAAGRAEVEVSLPEWHGTDVGHTDIEGATLDVTGYGFGGLGGRVTVAAVATASVGLTLGARFEAFWPPEGGGRRPEAAEGVAPSAPEDQAVPPWPRPWPHLDLQDRAVVAFSHRDRGRQGVGGGFAHPFEPASGRVEYRRAFSWPLGGTPHLSVTPTVWRRVEPTLFRLGEADAGRVFAGSIPGVGATLQVRALRRAPDGDLEWAHRFKGPGLRPGLLQRYPEGQRFWPPGWWGVPHAGALDAWTVTRGPLIGPEQRIEVACVGFGYPGGVNCCPICQTKRDSRCLCRPCRRTGREAGARF